MAAQTRLPPSEDQRNRVKKYPLQIDSDQGLHFKGHIVQDWAKTHDMKCRLPFSKKPRTASVGRCQDVPGAVTRSQDERGCSPRGCPGGPACPFPPSVSLLLGFLLIFGNIIYSNKASLEKSKPFWKCLRLLWLRTRP